MRIYLGGQFSFYLPGRPVWVELPLDAPARLSEALERLGIPPAEVFLAAVNGQAVDPAQAVVQDGDVVRLYPPVGGG